MLDQLQARSRYPLLEGPTPIQRLKRLEAAMGPDCPPIYVKRDDLMGLGGGGNKLRKLEFLIGEALATGCDTFITTGARQSNHARLSAAASARAGLACELVLTDTVDRTDDAYLHNGNVLLDDLFGATVHRLSRGADALRFAKERAAQLTSEGRQPYVVGSGGSSPVGCLGYVACAAEIVGQEKELGLRFAQIIVPNGSSGTHAGLAAGLRALGDDPSRSRSFTVLAPLGDAMNKTWELAAETLKLLDPNRSIDREEIRISADALGDGYDAGAVVGAIALNKSRVALRRLETPLILDVEVERTAFAVGQDADRVSLRRYIDAQDGFILLFSALEFAYIGGSLFRDDSLVDGGADLLRRLRPEPLLAAVTDEKGTFTPAHTAFDADSCFGVVVNQVSAGDHVLVCDDLGDEWADFIGLNNGSSPPRVTFYHAKHGALSLGAGPFHVAIAQALKNLRRMSLPTNAVRQKVPGWRRRYISGGGVHTAIPRIVRGNRQQIPAEFEQARGAPDTFRRVMIVTSSLSYAAVEQALADIAAGQRPDAYFVQLYWLLLSYFSGCTDMGASGYVLCQV